MTIRLEIRLRRGRDGPDSLTLICDDGSATWRHLPRGQAHHDLAHLAVESQLRLSDGFYGLVAKGKELSDFESRETRGPTPAEAMLTEFVVNQLVLEHASGHFADVDEFNAVILSTLENHGHGELTHAHRPLTADELSCVRREARSLWSRWYNTVPGDAMALTFVCHGQ